VTPGYPKNNTQPEYSLNLNLIIRWSDRAMNIDLNSTKLWKTCHDRSNLDDRDFAAPKLAFEGNINCSDAALIGEFIQSKQSHRCHFNDSTIVHAGSNSREELFRV